jgi:hypothetical protein
MGVLLTPGYSSRRPCWYIFGDMRSIFEMVPPVDVLKRYVKLAFFAVVCSLLLTYLGDYAIVRLRNAEQGSDLFGSVEVMTVATMKSGRVEIYPHPTPQVCVHSLFPHLGYEPCWYLARSPVKLIGFYQRTPLVERAALL